MATYRAVFVGRKTGTIDDTYPTVTIVQGDDEESARAALQDEYEYISRLTLTVEQA